MFQFSILVRKSEKQRPSACTYCFNRWLWWQKQRNYISLYLWQKGNSEKTILKWQNAYSVGAPASSPTWFAVIQLLRKSLIQLCYFSSPLPSLSSLLFSRHHNLNPREKKKNHFVCICNNNILIQAWKLCLIMKPLSLGNAVGDKIILMSQCTNTLLFSLTYTQASG